MNRRKFLIGAGGVTIGGSALLGSGAFSRVESHRDLTVQVAEDPDAYVGLAECDTVLGDNYVEIDEHGHLEIDIAESGNDGFGVNSNSVTFFDNVFQVTNQGKEATCVYIERPEDWPETEDGDPRVVFYVGDDRETSILGFENRVGLDIGHSTCVGIRTLTKGVDATETDDLLADVDDVKFVADVGLDCPPVGEPEVPVEEEPALDITEFDIEDQELDNDTTGEFDVPVTVAETAGEEAENVTVEVAIEDENGTTVFEAGPESLGNLDGDDTEETFQAELEEAGTYEATATADADNADTVSASTTFQVIDDEDEEDEADHVEQTGDPVALDGDIDGPGLDPKNAKVRFQLENVGDKDVTVDGIRFEGTTAQRDGGFFSPDEPAVRVSSYWNALDDDETRDQGESAGNPEVLFDDETAIQITGNPNVSLFFYDEETAEFEGLDGFSQRCIDPGFFVCNEFGAEIGAGFEQTPAGAADGFYPFDDAGSGDWTGPELLAASEQTIEAGETVEVEIGEFRVADIFVPNAVDLAGEDVTLSLGFADGSIETLALEDIQEEVDWFDGESAPSPLVTDDESAEDDQLA